LKKCNFDNYYPQDETQAKFLELSKKFVDRFKKGISYNLLVHSPYAVGKSHLAYALCEGLTQKGFSVVFLSTRLLLKQLRNSYALKDGGEMKILRTLQNVDLLVLDGLGAEEHNKWAEDILLTIIESRAGKCTLYTSTLDADGIKNRMTPENFRKFELDMQYFKINGQDYKIKSGKFEQSV
jgi:DNA replication protein DnaC